MCVNIEVTPLQGLYADWDEERLTVLLDPSSVTDNRMALYCVRRILQDRGIPQPRSDAVCWCGAPVVLPALSAAAQGEARLSRPRRAVWGVTAIALGALLATSGVAAAAAQTGSRDRDIPPATAALTPMPQGQVAAPHHPMVATISQRRIKPRYETTATPEPQAPKRAAKASKHHHARPGAGKSERHHQHRGRLGTAPVVALPAPAPALTPALQIPVVELPDIHGLIQVTLRADRVITLDLNLRQASRSPQQ